MEFKHKEIEKKISDIYKYSEPSIAVLSQKKNDENRNNNVYKNDKQQLLEKENEKFIDEFIIFLEKNLRHNIKLYQKGFETYKQKMLLNKNLILNCLDKDILNLTINQLINLLKQVKNSSQSNLDNSKENLGKINPFNIAKKIDQMNNLFSLGSFEVNNHTKPIKDSNNDIISNDIPSNIQKKMGKNFELSKHKNISFIDPNQIYHSPSPLIFKKNDSKPIIEDKSNKNDILDFSTPKKIGEESK